MSNLAEDYYGSQIFLCRGVREISQQAPWNNYFHLDPSAHESSPIWARYFFLQADISGIPDNLPQISVTPEEGRAEIVHSTGGKTFTLNFKNISNRE